MSTHPTLVGTPTYAGSYRMVYVGEQRFLEVRRGARFVRIDRPIPTHIRGAYAAASWLGV